MLMKGLFTGGLLAVGLGFCTPVYAWENKLTHPVLSVAAVGKEKPQICFVNSICPYYLRNARFPSLGPLWRSPLSCPHYSR